MPPSNSPLPMDRSYRDVRCPPAATTANNDGIDLVQLMKAMGLDESASVDDMKSLLNRVTQSVNNISLGGDATLQDLTERYSKVTLDDQRTSSTCTVDNTSPTGSDRSKENEPTRPPSRSRSSPRASPLRNLFRKTSEERRSRTPTQSHQKPSPLRTRRSPSPLHMFGRRNKNNGAAEQQGRPPTPSRAQKTPVPPPPPVMETPRSDFPGFFSPPSTTGTFDSLPSPPPDTPGLDTPKGTIPDTPAAAAANNCATGDHKVRRKTATPLANTFNPLVSPEFNLGKSTKKAKSSRATRRVRKDPPAPQARAPFGNNFGQPFVQQPQVTQQVTQQEAAFASYASPPIQAATNPTTPFSAVSAMSVDEDQSVSFSIGSKVLSPNRRSAARRKNRLATPRNRNRFPQPSFSPEVVVVQPDAQPQVQAAVPTVDPTVDYSGQKAMIESFRAEARSQYVAENYRASVMLYTKALVTYSNTKTTVQQGPDDLRAILLANRGAALLMLCCFEAAASNCLEAANFVSPLEPDAHGNYVLSAEGGPILKAKLYTRLGRTLTKQGKLDEASRAFDEALTTTELTLGVMPDFDQNDPIVAQLNQVRVDAVSGRTEINQCREFVASIKECGLRTPADAATVARRMNLRALSSINSALGLAPACIELMHLKLGVLSALNRWRELHICCERFAADTVKWEGVFEHDLQGRNPLPNVPEAKFLKPGLFNDPEVKLSSKAVTEVLLRLPARMQELYVRALRLEERCHPALNAVMVLGQFVIQFVAREDQQKHSWINAEKSKLERTTSAKEHADTRFRTADYRGAIEHYTICLRIDTEDTHGAAEGSTGGRLSAVLHCNRAAAYMAMSNYREAISDSSAALRIHPHYMKATLRKSRSFARLKRFEEAQTAYEGYITLVETTRASGSLGASSACKFDGPKDVTDEDLEKVRHELQEVKRAKINAEHTARAEEAERKKRQEWFDDAFHQSRQRTAEERRQEWYSQQSQSSRHWDSFNGKGANRSSRSQQQQQQQQGPREGYAHRQNSYSRQQSYREEPKKKETPASSSPGSDTTVCHYKILDIPRNATEAAIKKAYKKAALKWHPDKSQEEGAADTFRRIKLAYDVLKDEETRATYDRETRWNRGRF